MCDKSGDYGMGEKIIFHTGSLWKQNRVVIGGRIKTLTFFTLSIRYCTMVFAF